MRVSREGAKAVALARIGLTALLFFYLLEFARSGSKTAAFLEVAFMAFLSRVLFAFCLSLLCVSAQAQDRPFKNADVERAARDYEAYLVANWPTAGSDFKGWIGKANAAMKAVDPRRATGAFASAVVLDKNAADAWLALARAYLAIKTDNANEKQSFPASASSAAYIAYERATSPAAKAAALAVLGESLAIRSSWRPAIEAYRTSLKLAPSTVVKAAYDAVVADHGFRMLDYTVDNEAAAPRVCIQFSEPLSKVEKDMAKFVTLNGAAAPSVKADNTQLCVEDLVHGRRYEVKVRAGVPSTIPEEPLSKSVDLTVYVRDRKPAVRFTGRSYVLPRAGQQGLPLVSVNAKAVTVEIYHVGDRRLAAEVLDGDFANAIGGYKAEQLRDAQGEKLWSGEMTVASKLNEDVTTAFPIDQLLPNLKSGLYVMVAAPVGDASESWEEKATQWFVVSDIGLSAMTGRDGVHAFVRSLASGRALPGVELRLIARNNEVLATAASDAQGYAKFDPGLARGVGGLAPAIIVARGAENDYGFIDLTKSAFDLTDRGVGGRQHPGPLDPHLFTERGVYRPGETVHATALLRDDAAQATTLPLTLKIIRPDGVEHRSETIADAGLGGRTLAIPLSHTAMTGTWRIAAHADAKGPALADVRFLVEDYTPERLDMTLTPAAQIAAPGKPIAVAVASRYLYGAPASGLGLEGEVVVDKRAAGSPAHPGYVFGASGEAFTPRRAPLNGSPATDATGAAALSLPLPELPATAEPLEARVAIRLREPSGRAIERSFTTPIAARADAIGVKPLFEGGQIGSGEPARFDVIVAHADGGLAAAPGLTWEAVKLESRFQWYRRDGRWDYEVVEYARKIANGSVDAAAAGPARIETALEDGAYRLEVSSPSNPALVTTVDFSVGWRMSEASDKPDILELSLDKDAYAPGDAMRVRIEPRMAGEAIVAIVSDRLLAMQTVPVSAQGGEASFTVAPEWGAGAYATVLLFRPLDEAAKRMPSRAVGVKWLPFNARDRVLSVKLNAPDKIRPNGSLTLPVTLGGLTPGEKAYLTVAAVDVGILNLTGHKPAKPDEFYFGQRRLGMELRDLYGRLIDGMQGVRGAIRTGGDGGISMQGRPLASEPVSLFSGIVEARADGTADVTFAMPAFEGAVRVNVAAWSASKLGHAVAEVAVHDPVVMTATPPRFLTLGDASEIHVSVHNVEGEAGEYVVAPAVEGGVATSGSVTRSSLPAGARANFAVPITAAATGPGAVTLTLTGPGGFSATRVFKLDVAPPAPNVTRRIAQTLAAKTGALTVNESLIADLAPGSAKVVVNVGRAAAFDVPGALLSLDRYPYGCAEQTISRALPLLYFNEVAEAAGMAGESGAKTRIAKAIERLAALQGSNGGFGLWSPFNEDVWITAYAADFLARAKEKGHAVPAATLETALDRLKNSVNAAEDFESGGEDLAYALYVLARSGRAVIGDLRYYADTKIDAFRTPLAKAQIGAALAMYGDKERAEAAFAAAVEALKPAPDPDLTASRADFGTALRDNAATLTLISESGASPGAAPALSSSVRRLRDLSRGLNTQEAAWVLLAARALITDDKNLALTVNGATQSGQVSRALSADDIARAPLKIANTGDQPAPASIIVSGDGLQPEPASANGFTIERDVFTPDGRPASLAKARQNDRFVVVLKVKEAEALLGHVVIEDRLPAGFEIENPRLLKGATLKAFSWLKDDQTPAFSQFRDDRFIAAFAFTDPEREAPAEMTLAYVVRAVSPGDYLHPGAKVEDMYRPERFARTEPGRVQIVKP
ncbi:MAG: alpha-2-macroglobulin [Hyphomicrobiales bacterium]|nr:alpha-2-macroglobulin [Hyphomicrobiales bacterium]